MRPFLVKILFIDYNIAISQFKPIACTVDLLLPLLDHLHIFIVLVNLKIDGLFSYNNW